MTFRYVAIGPTGEEVSGSLDAPTETQAEKALWDADYRVISLRPLRQLPSIERILPSLFAVKKRDLVTFARQLATLLESGVPVMRSLELLESQAQSRPLLRAIRGVSRTVRGGTTFAEAVREFPTIFPPIFGRMIEVGERTGRIEDTLRQVASYLEREDEIAKRIRSAMAYPAFIVVLAFVVIGVLMTTALPTLVQLFDEFDGQLPITTRILIGVTNFTTAHRMNIVAVLALSVLGCTWFFQRPAGHRFIDRALLVVPVTRALVINTNAARLSRTLSMLLRAGLPLTEIVDMVVRTTENSVLRERTSEVRRRLLDGEGLAGPMQAAGCYPQMLVQMVAVGEETGTLDANLEITAEFYSREVDQKVDALTGMLTPAMTLVIGVLVGFIALSLIMPMYQLVGTVNDATSGAPPP
ncbi:MAG TPA: type II secretion system F family protein [Dehalococcoidia bacterium]